jgi:CopG family transcriptional regulator, nickel-responsive regulator
MSVSRFGISIEQELQKALDEYVKENGFSNRSQAIRQLISKNIVEHKWLCNNYVAGSIILIYDPSKREILNNIATVQAGFSSEIISSQRFVIAENRSLEIVAVKGIAMRLTSLAEQLIAIKGILHGKLAMSRAD